MANNFNFMKTVKPNSSGYSKNCIQGYFTPVNKSKYVGTMPIIYRSSLELRFCRFCDEEPKILRWSSEDIKVEYYNPIEAKGKNYYPDYYMKLAKGGEVVEYLVEVKPLSQLIKPDQPAYNASKTTIKNYNLKLKVYIVNMAKKLAAESYCKLRGMKYIFVTESFFE